VVSTFIKVVRGKPRAGTNPGKGSYKGFKFLIMETNKMV
jgi:hypothetical protein